MLFDTHCHLYDEKYEEGIDRVIARSFERGVDLLMLVGDNAKHSEICALTAKRYENVYASIGIHPLEIDSIGLDEIETRLAPLLSEKIKAVGEIGLDYYWNKDETLRERQKAYFIRQIAIADRWNLPVIIHARDSVEDALEIVKEHPCRKKGVFHCFSGSVEQMRRIVRMGYSIGLDGPVTYKNAITPKEVAKAVDLSSLVVETDSPYLPPVPYRGKINYPEYVRRVIEEIAALRGLRPEEIEEITFQNGKRLFGL
mgnify:FL=1